MPARILEISSYPPPRAGWGIRVEFLKKALEQQGHVCVVLNIGTSRRIPSPEYETVLGALDFVRKVFRFSRQGYTVHAHANGDSTTGLMLALIAETIALCCGQRCHLTFHAGAIQRYFPTEKSVLLRPAFWLLFTIPKRIICNSPLVKQCIARYGIRADKIVPIPAFSTQYVQFTPTPLPERVEQFFARYSQAVFAYVRMRRLFFPAVMVDGMARVMAERADVGLILVGGTGHADEGIHEEFQAAVARHGIADRLLLIDDLDHDAFLTVLERSALYLRTPITDGVASSVLESLTLKVPVVAAENGARPPGVVTYGAEDSSGLAAAVLHVLADREAIAAALPAPAVPDTLGAEIAVLIGADGRGTAPAGAS